MSTYTIFKIIWFVLLLIVLISVVVKKKSSKQLDSEPKTSIKERTFRIGRLPNNDVVVSNPTVHRIHAEITQHEDGSYSLRDCQTATGTVVNGKLIKGEVAIKPGDIIQLGTEVIPWESYFITVP